MTWSPSSRNTRFSPFGRRSGSNRCFIFRRQPSDPSLGPEIVPVASKSPARRLHPLLEWCVTNCRSRPIQIAQIPSADEHRLDTCVAHLARLKKHFERDIDAVQCRSW